jgi:hypothetical protein
MGFLDDCLTDDAAAFVDSDVFGESVVYTPRCSPGVTINAVIIRDPPAARDGAPGARRPKMLAFIRNHTTLGRTAIDTGGDTITVAYRKGGDARAYQVTGPVNQDAGMWELELS